VLLLVIALAQAGVPAVRCSVTGDAHARVFELQRLGDGERTRWQLILNSRDTGNKPVALPLPNAKPAVDGRQLALEYRTLNGGRTVTWKVDSAGGATLDVYTNFELEVNVDADLDPRVELMNTEGPITNLSCEIAPKR
jgi:hypothetical protein